MRAGAALLVAFALAGCASEAPRTAYDLSPIEAPRLKRPFAVEVSAPDAAANLDSARILVRDGGDPFVLADAQWERPLPALVAARIGETLNSPAGPPRVRLALSIEKFELLAQRKTVALAILATVTDAASGRVLRKRDFSAAAAVATTRPTDVAAGFDRAFAGLQARIAAFAYDP